MFTSRKLLLFGALVVATSLGALVASDRVCLTGLRNCAETTVVASPEVESTQLAPRYYTYSPSAASQALMAGHRVVLYFWAPWCTSCASLDTEIENNPDLIPERALILQVPYETATELRSTYNVITQHTFVEIDASQAAIQTWVGGDGDELSDRLSN